MKILKKINKSINLTFFKIFKKFEKTPSFTMNSKFPASNRSKTPTKNFATSPQNSSSSSESDSEVLSSDQISLNKLLFEAQNLYRNKERTLSLEKYKEGLDLAKKMNDYIKIAHLQTNIAVISFENGEYKNAMLLLEEAFSHLNLIHKGELLQELKLKILVSLCVINVVLNHFEKAKEYGTKLTNFLIGMTNKRAGLELVVFSLYKFISFSSMETINIENIEEICKIYDIFIYTHVL